jgi:hypothetical protein
VEPLGPAQVTRVTWALAVLDCQLPADLSAQLFAQGVWVNRTCL